MRARFCLLLFCSWIALGLPRRRGCIQPTKPDCWLYHTTRLFWSPCWLRMLMMIVTLLISLFVAALFPAYNYDGSGMAPRSVVAQSWLPSALWWFAGFLAATAFRKNNRQKTPDSKWDKIIFSSWNGAIESTLFWCKFSFVIIVGIMCKNFSSQNT